MRGKLQFRKFFCIRLSFCKKRSCWDGVLTFLSDSNYFEQHYSKLLFSNSYIFATQCLWPWAISKYEFCQIKSSKFELSKVYPIRVISCCFARFISLSRDLYRFREIYITFARFISRSIIYVIEYMLENVMPLFP